MLSILFFFFLNLRLFTYLFFFLIQFLSVLSLYFLSPGFLQTTLLSNFLNLLLHSVTVILACLIMKAFATLNLLLITALSGPIALLHTMLIPAGF